MNLSQLRGRLGSWIAGRAAPITFAPEQAGTYLGTGLGGNQPDAQTLLRENLGVADIATRAIANRLATLNPLVKVSYRDSKGTLVDETLDDHVLKSLLDNPHEDFTRQQILRLLGQYILSTGAGYLLKINNGLGVPAMLSPIPSQHIAPVIRKGIVASYQIKDGKGNIHTVPKREVIRAWFPDPETLYESEGYIGPNAVVTDSLRFAGEHLRAHYQNDATPRLILEAGDEAQAPTPEQWRTWVRDYARRHHARLGTERGLPAMLPNGWKAVLVALQSGADVTPLLEYWTSEQLMNFGVPQSVLGRVVSGDRSAAETNQYVFDRYAVLPIAMLIEQALTLQLARDFDGALFIEFEEFVSADKDFELRREAQDLALKVRSGQQVLEDRGEDPERAPWAEFPVGSIADTPYTGEEPEPVADDDPTALFDPEGDSEGEVPDDAVSDDEDDRTRSFNPHRRRAYFSPENEWKRVLRRERRFVPRFERGLKTIFNAQRKETIRRLEELAADRSRSDIPAEAIFNPDDWDKLFAVKVEKIRAAAYVYSAKEAIAGIGSGKFIFTPEVAKRLDAFGGVMAKQVGRTTLKRLQRALAQGAADGLSMGQLSKSVNAAFHGRRRNAATIARTELLRATQDAQVEGFRQSGVVEYKRWNDNGDADVRDSHYGSLIEVVKVGESFTLADGSRAAYPGDAGLDPSNSINCRCFVTPEFDDPEGINE